MNLTSLTATLLLTLFGNAYAGVVPDAIRVARQDVESVAVQSVESLASSLVRQVFAFTDGTFFENIATRSNGNLILTTLTHPWVYTLNPMATSPKATVLASFDSSVANSVLGIVEYALDQFAVITELSNTATMSGTNTTIWTLDLRSSTPRTRQVAQLPAGSMGNGLTAIPGTSLVLVADTTVGAVWSVNVVTGAYRMVIKDAGMAPASTTLPLGINGLRVYGSLLYFVNSSKGTVGRLAIRTDGTAASPIQYLATTPSGQFAYDDFAIDKGGRLWIAAHTNAVDLVYPNGKQVVVTTSLNISSTDRGPTSAAFGRGSRTQEQFLYVTSASGIVWAVDTSQVKM
ncbi:hypothetical protein BKA62DRAFT_343435 [Auriculariales sp. MPI-PUGE-AT-0066]|nr:hypothetical protein BKA62DRAFT_343435 [Auriculariales sp. MPI-PUGE-AT-0066]